MTEPNILLVDDEQQFSFMTKEYLQAKNCQVTLVHNAVDGLQAFKDHQFHICVLDVKMPIKDGFSLAGDIKSINPEIPLIFLTGQQEQSDRIKGLTLGADDYITKPFSMEELFLRIQNILKRAYPPTAPSNTSFKVGQYHFNALSRELILQEDVQKLSAIEAQLLQLFCEAEQGLLKRDVALHKIWKDEDYLKGRSLNVYVSKLRKLLKQDSNIEILNVHGEGYRMLIKE